MEHYVLDSVRAPLGELTCKQCSTNVKNDKLLPTNSVCGYSAQAGIRFLTSPLIIASKYPICESCDIKHQSGVNKSFMI